MPSQELDSKRRSNSQNRKNQWIKQNNKPKQKVSSAGQQQLKRLLPDSKIYYIKQKPKQNVEPLKPDSRIHFVKLPPQPYTYDSSLGAYVSRLPTFLNRRVETEPFYNLPIEFVSNGKPHGIRTSSSPYQKYSTTTESIDHGYDRYTTDSPVIRLNLGPYKFNGRPNSIQAYKSEKSPKDSLKIRLNNGPYLFNGKPHDHLYRLDVKSDRIIDMVR